jgi:hypothetical protein
MAINQWVNVTLNTAATAPDPRFNTKTQGTAAANNLCVSWDSAVVTTLTQWDSCVASARLIAQAQMNP